MPNETCSSCGNNTFNKGKISNSHARVYPIDKMMSTGSPMIVTFCSKCGEVSSIKVKQPQKFD
jgi:uncharacterized Zn finger protein (UPF0148 family)